MSASMSGALASDAWPLEIRIVADAHALEIVWDDAGRVRLSSHTLRRHCRCAECRQTLLRGGAISPDEDVILARVDPCGPGALNLCFSDGHARGIFPFAYLRELALRQSAIPDPLT